MATLGDTEIIIKSFFDSRKSNKTRKEAAEIINFLIARFQKCPDYPFVQAKEIQAHFKDVIPDSTLFRQLADMERKGIVKREEHIEISETSKAGKKKPSVYYRIELSIKYPVETPSDRALGKIAKRYKELAIAKRLLKDCHKKNPNYDPDAAIKTIFDEENSDYARFIPEDEEKED